MKHLLSLFIRNLIEDFKTALDLLMPLPFVAKIVVLPIVVPVVLIVTTVNTLDDIFLPNPLKSPFDHKVTQDNEEYQDMNFSWLLMELSQWFEFTPKKEKEFSAQSAEVEEIRDSNATMLQGLTNEEERANLAQRTTSSVNYSDSNLYDLEEYRKQLNNPDIKVEVIEPEVPVIQVDENYKPENTSLNDYVAMLQENSVIPKPGN